MRLLQYYETNTFNNVYLQSKDPQKSMPNWKSARTSERMLKRTPNKVAGTIRGMPIASTYLASNWSRAWV